MKTLFLAGLCASLLTACLFDPQKENDWKVRASGTDHDLYDVAWSGTQAVAVSYWGEAVTSPDGIHWTVRPTGTSAWLKAVCWTGAAFVAVGRQGTVLTSPDGIAWTLRIVADTVVFTDVTWTGTLLIAVGPDGIWTSPDAVAWTARSTGTPKSLMGVAWAQGHAVAVGADSLIYTSVDGITWTGHPSGVPGGLEYVAGNATEFLAGQPLTGIMLRSADGITWTPQDSLGTLLTSAPLWTGSEWVLAGFNKKGLRIFKSPDGVQWTSSPQSYFNHTVNALAWTGTMLIGVGDYGSIITNQKP